MAANSVTTAQDPPGTVRRDPHTGVVAVRTAPGAPGYWLIVQMGRGPSYTNDRSGVVASWTELRP